MEGNLGEAFATATITFHNNWVKVVLPSWGRMVEEALREEEHNSLVIADGRKFTIEVAASLGVGVE